VYLPAVPSAQPMQAGLWQVFLSSQRYQESSGFWGGPAYQPVSE